LYDNVTVEVIAYIANNDELYFPAGFFIDILPRPVV